MDQNRMNPPTLAVGHEILDVTDFAVARLKVVSLDLAGTTQVLVAGALPSTLFVGGGLYQFSTLKRACLQQCRMPLAFLLAEWRPGVTGAVRLALLHWRECVRCCWTVMALMLAAGMMNVAWMSILTMVMLAEKAAPRGDDIRRVSGIAFILWGAWQLAGPAILR
jgi:predicted metal-binding membrane protein